MRYIIRLLPIVFLLVLFVSVQSALALVTCAEFDFTVDDHGFVAQQPTLGTWVEEVGWVATLHPPINRKSIAIQGNGTEYGPLVYVYFEYTTNVNTGFNFYADGGEFATAVLFCAGDCNHTVTANNITSDDFVFFLWGPNNGSGNITLTYIRFTCEGTPPDEWIRPFSPDDEDLSWGLWDYNLVTAIDPDYFGELTTPFTAEDVLTYAVDCAQIECEIPYPFLLGHLVTPFLSTVIAASNDIGDPVMAATDGTVVNIQKLTQENCAEQIEPLVPNENNCWIKIPAVIGGTPNPFVELFYAVDLTRSYIVSLQIGEITQLRYIVDDPQVQIGDTINAGCILGTSVELIAVPVLAIQNIGASLSASLSLSGPSASVTIGAAFGFESQPISKGITFITYVEEAAFPAPEVILPLRQNLVLFSSPLEACNADPRYRSCAGDPELRHPEDWVESGGEVQWLYPGAILYPNARINMQLQLVETNAYSFNVEVEKLNDGSNPEVTTQIGGDVIITSITNLVGVPQHAFITSAIRAPDVGSFYTVAVHNTGDVPLRINSACVTEGDPNLEPNACYFFNSGFDLGGSGWTASTNVVFFSEFGTARVPSGETIAQFVHLFPDDEFTPHIYRFTVETGLWYDPSYVIDENDLTSTVELEYDWPETTGFENMTYVDGGTETPFFRSYALRHNSVTFEAFLNVSTETQGMLVIQPTITTADPEVLGLTIRSLCIYGPYPNQTTGQGQNPPFVSSCTLVTKPDGELFSAWITYHWENLNQFFQCHLMSLLNRMYKLGVDTFNLIGWLGRWTHSLITYGFDWFANQLLPWLNGHFANMATGGIVIQTGESGASFWDVLLALINQVISPIINLIVDLINQAATLVLTIVTAVISLVITVITMILGMFGLLITLITSIITSYQTATPAVIPGAPDCSNPQSSGFCVANWVLENTIFSGPGAAIIPVIIAIGSILFILWAISTIKQAVQEAVMSS